MRLRPDLPKSKLPLTAPKDAKDWFSYLWSDLNDDGQMQAEECQTTTASLDGGYWGGYWLDEQVQHLYRPRRLRHPDRLHRSAHGLDQGRDAHLGSDARSG